MSMRTENRNNVLAGLFVVVSLALTVFISFWVEDGFDKLPFVNPRASYVVRFDLAEGVAGLKPGSPVTLGGKTIGSVASIRYRTKDVDGRFAATGIDVTVKVDSDLVLYDDASVGVVAPLLGSLASLNISDIGGRAEGASVLARGGGIDAQPRGGIARLDDLVAEARRLLVTANRFSEKIEPKIGPIADDVSEAVRDVKAFAGDLRSSQQRWITKADSILDGAQGLFTETLPGVADEVTAGVGDARKLLGTTQGLIDENRADIRRTISNFEGLSTRARYDVMGRLERVLDEGLVAAGNMSDITGRALLTLDRIEPPLNRTMANLQLASSQAVLLVEEIRAAPWRALKPPSEKQQAQEVLYSAVRRYAEAVERLRDASGSLESVLNGARRDGREIPPDQVYQMTQEIKRSFSAYSEAEQDLLDLIARESGE